MDTRDAGRLGGIAKAAGMTPEERSAAMRHARAAGVAKQHKAATMRGDATRRAKAKARKVEKMRVASRKANR